MIKRFFSFFVSRFAPWALIVANVLFLSCVVLVFFVFRGTKEEADVAALLKKVEHHPAAVEKVIDAKPIDPEPVPQSTESLPPRVDIAEDLLERSAFGFLPKQGENGRAPWHVYAREDLWPEEKPYAVISLVVEQMGLNQSLLEQAKSILPKQVALAFNPYAEEVFSQMQLARQAGFETLLSLAIETRNYPYSDPGRMALLTSNTPEKNLELFSQQLSTAQGYLGVIPMMGRVARYDGSLMDFALKTIKTRGLMYIDTAEGVEADLHQKQAKNNNIPYAASFFHLESIDNREAFLKNLTQSALKTGSAVGILPPYPIVFQDVAAWAQKIKQEHPQLAFVPVSYQGRLFLDAPKPEPEPAPAADPHAKPNDKKDAKDDAKKPEKPKESGH